jgi:hypothetical protein
MKIEIEHLDCDRLLEECFKIRDYVDLRIEEDAVNVYEVEVAHFRDKDGNNCGKSYGRVILMARGCYTYSLVVDPMKAIFPAVNTASIRKDLVTEFL